MQHGPLYSLERGLTFCLSSILHPTELPILNLYAIIQTRITIFYNGGNGKLLCSLGAQLVFMNRSPYIGNVELYFNDYQNHKKIEY
jgi:hypothetical protein